MKDSRTNSQTKTISRAFPTSIALAGQIFILLIIGFAATWLHARFRFPLNLPGRHGLEFMLLIMGARYASSLRLSATVAVTGSILASLIPVLGFKDPMLPYIYLGMGGLIDFVWYKWNSFRSWILFVALLGGFAYALIPVVRIVFYFFTSVMDSSFLKHGFFIPILTHFAFGFIGAFSGAGIVSEIKKRISKKKSN